MHFRGQRLRGSAHWRESQGSAKGQGEHTSAQRLSENSEYRPLYAGDPTGFPLSRE